MSILPLLLVIFQNWVFTQNLSLYDCFYYSFLLLSLRSSLQFELEICPTTMKQTNKNTIYRILSNKNYNIYIRSNNNDLLKVRKYIFIACNLECSNLRVCCRHLLAGWRLTTWWLANLIPLSCKLGHIRKLNRRKKAQELKRLETEAMTMRNMHGSYETLGLYTDSLPLSLSPMSLSHSERERERDYRRMGRNQCWPKGLPL